MGNLAGNLAAYSVGNLMGKYSFLKPIFNGFLHMTHQIEAKNLLYKIKIFFKVSMVVTGLKMAEKHPITTTKTLSNYFYLVEVLSFDLVGHM